ncbi:MAG: sulfatase-like hydrolase/transferase, partial [Lachnospiraceae bacterium]|nr:sulfatase-like hydrolase/transferase [Lachnospiraceae bacterium]
MSSLWNKLKHHNNKLANILIFILTPIALFFISQNIMLDEVMQISWKMIGVNIFIMEVLAFTLLFLLRTGRRALYAEIGFYWFFSVLNAYIYEFRASFIMPWDILSAGTAMNVASNYNYTPTVRMAVGTLLTILLCIIVFFCRLDIRSFFRKKGETDGTENSPILSGEKLTKEQRKAEKIAKRGKLSRKELILRACGFILGFLGLWASTFLLQRNTVAQILEIYDIQFNSKEMMRLNGLTANFLFQTKFLVVKVPTGYKASDQAAILASYEENGPDLPPEDLPNIIIIVDEAFSDPKVDGDFTTNVDYMPFVHSLQQGAENTVTGYANVSVLGGNTPNSEFEVLTGYSMAFLPKGCIPFQQYLRHPVDSMPNYLKKMGYSTIAMHPYKSSGWNRTKAYPLLGFDTIHFDDYFEQFNPEIIRQYISDESFFQVIEKEVEELSKDGPVFSYNVTMQNHSSYSKEYENFPLEVSVNGITEMENSVIRINTYLSLMKKSDEAFERLVEYYKNQDKDTIILFFGDHQAEPSSMNIVWRQNKKDWQKLMGDDVINSYRVPFVIWANFDIEEEQGIETSLNYLGNYLLKKAGIPLGSYRSYTDSLMKDYPVISAIRSMDAAGKSETAIDFSSGPLRDYAAAQYYKLF